MSQFLNVNVISYYVKDWETAVKFYSDILEWPLSYRNDEIGWAEWGRENETHIAINRWDEADKPMPLAYGGTAVLSVEDCYKTTAALRAKGVRCDDVVNIPGVITFGTFYDPEGNRIQFAGGTP